MKARVGLITAVISTALLVQSAVSQAATNCVQQAILAFSNPLALTPEQLADIAFATGRTDPERLRAAVDLMLHLVGEHSLTERIEVFTRLQDEIQWRSWRGWRYKVYSNERIAVFRGVPSRNAVVLDDQGRVYVGILDVILRNDLAGFEITDFLGREATPGHSNRYLNELRAR